jgi:PKD repeat protein
MPAAFTVRRTGWNGFAFAALSPAQAGYRFAWDFGDGVTSNRHTLDHSFGSAGTYEVKLAVTDPEGRETRDAAVVHVPLMNLGNPVVKLAVSALSLLLLSGIVAFLRMALARRRAREIARAIDAAPLPREVSEVPAAEPSASPKGARKVRVRSE